MTDPLTLILALIIGTLAVARASRLVTSDDWPPTVVLRRWWFNHTVAKGGWRAGWGPVIAGEDVIGCPFCFAPYAAAVDLTWAVWSGLTWGGLTWGSAWWVVNVWAAVSYAAAMVVARDEPADG